MLSTAKWHKVDSDFRLVSLRSSCTFLQSVYFSGFQFRVSCVSTWLKSSCFESEKSERSRICYVERLVMMGSRERRSPRASREIPVLLFTSLCWFQEIGDVLGSFHTQHDTFLHFLNTCCGKRLAIENVFCCWCFVEVMKLNLGRDSEARFGQFEF